MIPSSDSRVSELGVGGGGTWWMNHGVNTILSSLRLNYLNAVSCVLTRARPMFRHIRLVVKATVSQLPGMIYVTMVTLAWSPLELVPSAELELHSICITFMASVSQLPLGTLDWVEASLIQQSCIRTGARFSLLNPYSLCLSPKAPV